MAKKTVAERRAARGAAFQAYQRHRHHRPFTVTPRPSFEIRPTSVTPPHELVKARARPSGDQPHPDGHFIPSEVPDGVKS